MDHRRARNTVRQDARLQCVGLQFLHKWEPDRDVHGLLHLISSALGRAIARPRVPDRAEQRSNALGGWGANIAHSGGATAWPRRDLPQFRGPHTQFRRFLACELLARGFGCHVSCARSVAANSAGARSANELCGRTPLQFRRHHRRTCRRVRSR